MATATVEKKINDYLVHLNDKQKKAVLTIAKTFAEEQVSKENIWDDKVFAAEIERRRNEMERGKIKGITWEEVKKNARKVIKRKK